MTHTATRKRKQRELQSTPIQDVEDDIVGSPDVVAPPWWAVFTDIDTERHAQLAKWGEQHHPDGTGGLFYRGWAKEYQRINDQRAKNGNSIWSTILLEEVFGAMAETDLKKLRNELVQSAAVITGWIEDIDSRTNG